MESDSLSDDNDLLMSVYVVNLSPRMLENMTVCIFGGGSHLNQKKTKCRPLIHLLTGMTLILSLAVINTCGLGGHRAVTRSTALPWPQVMSLDVEIKRFC